MVKTIKERLAVIEYKLNIVLVAFGLFKGFELVPVVIAMFP